MGILTVAWWAAKALGVRTAVGRFFNGAGLGALAIGVGAALLMSLFAWGVHVIRSGEASEWKATIAQSKFLGQVRARMRDRRVEEAAARERQVYVEQIESMAGHAVALEQQLADLRAAQAAQAAPVNPVIYPQSLVKELRK